MKHNTLHNDLTDKDIFPLVDEDQLLQSYRKSEHFIRKEFVRGVVFGVDTRYRLEPTNVKQSK